MLNGTRLTFLNCHHVTQESILFVRTSNASLGFSLSFEPALAMRCRSGMVQETNPDVSLPSVQKGAALPTIPPAMT